MKAGLCVTTLVLMLMLLIGFDDACSSLRLTDMTNRTRRFTRPYAKARYIKRGSCVKARPDPTCGDLSPKMTWFPNIFRLKNQTQSYMELQSYKPLLGTTCSPFVKTFLCSVYYPQCTEDGRMRLPCRNLCEASRFGCDRVLVMFGFVWPKMLRCDLFPTDSCFSGNVMETLAGFMGRAVNATAGGVNGTTTDNNDFHVNSTTSPGLDEAEASSSATCCAAEMAAEDTPTDCVEGGDQCRNASVVSFVDGQTACCFDGRQLSYTTSCAGGRSGGSSGGNGLSLRTACKCSYTTMGSHQEW